MKIINLIYGISFIQYDITYSKDFKPNKTIRITPFTYICTNYIRIYKSVLNESDFTFYEIKKFFKKEDMIKIVWIIEEYDNGNTQEFNPKDYRVVKKEDVERWKRLLGFMNSDDPEDYKAPVYALKKGFEKYLPPEDKE